MEEEEEQKGEEVEQVEEEVEEVEEELDEDMDGKIKHDAWMRWMGRSEATVEWRGWGR